MDFFALIVCAVVLLLSYLWYWRANRHLPPGPVSIFGNLFGKTWYEGVDNAMLYRKQYGDIFSVRVLGKTCIYLNTHALIRQYFVVHADKFSGRLNLSDIGHKFVKHRGIVQSDGLSWQEHRRFALSVLRDFGFGRNATEQIIQNELQQLTQYFETYDGKVLDPRLSVNMATANVICSLVFGERCGNEPGFEPIFQMITESLDGPITKLHEVIVHRVLKIMTKFPVLYFKWLFNNLDKVSDYVDAKIAAHKQAYKGEVHDLIDAYIQEMRGEGDGNHSHETFNEGELRRIIVDLFVAGMEPSASTLRWALYLMVNHPDVQRRVQAELDEVLQQRSPSSADRKLLPYTDAVIMEVQRYFTFSPLGGIPHRCTEQVQMGQYLIPKDTLVYANLLCAHRDPAIWPDPMNFNPDNFYNHDKSVKNTEYLIPFVIGKRSCLGESLAKQEMFVLFAGLFQKFELSAPPGEALPDKGTSLIGRMTAPPNFSIFVKKRIVK